MTGLWLEMIGDAWRMAAAGFICAVLIGVFAGPGDEFSGAPAEDDEEFPEDPDRDRDWQIADEMGAL